MALTVTLLSIKGGVGKTTTAVNLAALAATGGLRTLVWDLDPQGAASFALGVDERFPGGARRVTHKEPGLVAAVSHTEWPCLDVIPADFSLRHLDIDLAAQHKPKRRLAEALEPIADDYDVVFIDCAPGINLANESAMRATNVVLSPIVPSTLSLRAYDQLVACVAADDKLRRAQVLGFLSMVDRRKKGHRDLCERLPAERDQVLRTNIPASVMIEMSPDQRTPLVIARMESPAAVAYRDLWNELQSRALGGLAN